MARVRGPRNTCGMILTALRARTSGKSTPARTALGVGGASLLAVVLAGCSNADQANAYTDALNSVQLKINNVVSATSSSEAFETALTQNLPAIKTDIQQLQSASGNLSSESKAIAEECTGDVNSIVTGLEAISAGVKAKDNAAVTSARTTTNVEIASLKSCIDKWNTNNGTNGS